MRFLSTTMIVSFKCIRKKIFILAMILTMAMLLSYAIVFFAQSSLASEDFKIDIAFVNLDDNETMIFLERIILNNEEIEKRFNIVKATSLEEGKEKVASNEVLGCVLLPEGFLESVLIGENIAPEVYTPKLSTLEKYIMESFVESLEMIMVSTQSAIYTTFDELQKNNLYQEHHLQEVNMDFVMTLLKLFNQFDNEGISYTNNLSIQQHYTISIIVFLLYLTTVLFYNEMSINTEINVLKMIKNNNTKYSFLYFSKLIVLFIVYLVIFMILNIYLEGDFSVWFMISSINVVILFILTQSIIFNISKEYIPTVYMSYIFHIVSLIVSGGIIPTILLPRVISSMQVISPIYHIRELYSVAFIDVENILLYNVVIMVVNVLMILITNSLVKRATK